MVADDAIRRLDHQLDRARRLYEGRVRRADVSPEAIGDTRRPGTATSGSRDARAATDFEWCRVQIFDLVSTWDDADGGQRIALLGDLFQQIEVTYARRGKVKAVVIPRKEWQAYLRFSALERETGLEPATSTLGRSRSAR